MTCGARVPLARPWPAIKPHAPTWMRLGMRAAGAAFVGRHGRSERLAGGAEATRWRRQADKTEEREKMARTIVSIINGRPAEGARGGRVESPNPSRLADVGADVTLADAATFAAACTAAKQAQPLWADVPAPVRGKTVAAIGRIVEANKEPLARLVTRELGKPYAEAVGEVQEIIDTCDFFLGEGRRLYGQTVPRELPGKQLV